MIPSEPVIPNEVRNLLPYQVFNKKICIKNRADSQGAQTIIECSALKGLNMPERPLLIYVK
jgi:hypothetical protein